MKTGIIQKLICGLVVAWFAFGARADSGSSVTNSERKAQNTELASKPTAESEPKRYGLWVFGKDMNDVDLNPLKDLGITDLLLHEHAITLFGQPAVEEWIAKANELGIKVHIWLQAFYEGRWVNPAKNGNPKLGLFAKKMAHAKQCARIRGVEGIHFDYLRCGGRAYKNPGSTDAITRFAKFAEQHLHQVNPKLIVSAALMPETTETAHYYGQDYEDLSQYFDVVIPMIYKANFKQKSPWIAKTTAWYVKHSKGAKVWAGLQGYEVVEKKVIRYPTDEIKADVDATFESGATGSIIFRWGLTNLVPLKPPAEKPKGE